MDELKNKLEIQQYRLGFLLILIIYLPYGLISQFLLGFAYDTFLIRLPISIVALIFLIASYKVDFVKSNLRYFFLPIALAVTYQYFGFFKLSHEHFFYTIGIAVIPIITAVFFII